MGNSFTTTAASSGGAAPTLTIDYLYLLREISRKIGLGLTYDTGTVAASSGVVTLTSGTFPAWAGSTTSGTSAINIAGSYYKVTNRNSDTEILISDGAASHSAGAAYVIVQSQTDDKTDDLRLLDDIVEEGYRTFLHPHPLEKRRRPHIWSFIMKNATLTLSSGDLDYNLPADFGQHIAWAGYSVATDLRRMEIISQLEMEAKRSMDDASGDPKYITWRPKSFVSSTGQRFEAILAPKPNATRTVNYSYRVNPDKLNPTNKFPLGGELHAETLLAACLASADRKTDNAENSLYEGLYQTRLAASLYADLSVKPI